MRNRIKWHWLTMITRIGSVGFGGLVFLTLLIAGNPAESAEPSYYSIHVASFQNLQNANRHVNSLQEKEKLVFWKEIDIPDKGVYYRVFLGRYATREEAVRSWEKLNQAGAVSYFGVYEFKESVASLKPLQAPIEKPLPPTAEVLSPQPAAPRFVDNLDGTVTDTQTHLMWVKNGWRIDFVSALTWPEAIEKCRNFSLGGHKDWRLSSVEEWKTLLDADRQAPALVEPNPFENIVIHMPYWSQTEFAVAGDPAAKSFPPSARAYTVMLYTGKIHHQNKNDYAFVMPVRVNK